MGNDLQPSQRQTEQRITIMLWGSLMGFLLVVLSIITSQRLFLWLGIATWIASVLTGAILRVIAIVQRKRQQARTGKDIPMDNEPQSIQSENLYRRRKRLIIGMMSASLIVAFIFSTWAVSYHVALFWWLTGAAWAAFIVLTVMRDRQKEVRKKEQQIST